jgi:hypothetical protein
LFRPETPKYFNFPYESDSRTNISSNSISVQKIKRATGPPRCASPPSRSNPKLKFTKFSAPTPGDKPPPRCRNSPRINPSRFFALHQINSPPLCPQRHDNSSVRLATPIGGVRSDGEDSSNGVFENKNFVSDYTLPVPLWQARASDSFKKRRPTVPSMVRTRPDILSV